MSTSNPTTTTARRSRLGVRRLLGLGVLTGVLGVGALQFASTPSASALAGTGTATIMDGGTTGLKGKFSIGSFVTGASTESTVSSSTGVTGGKVQFSSVKITKSVDSQSPTLFKAMATGTPIGRIDIARGTATYRYTTVFVVKIDVAGTAEDIETIELIYAQVQVDSGAVRTCWNQITNTECTPTN